LSAAHTVPAVGFAVQGQGQGPKGGHWVFTGDTGPNPALWQRLCALPIAHLVIETAFGDDEEQLARVSRHLCPRALGGELAQLSGNVEVHITHIKPGEGESVMNEIAALATAHRISALKAGDVMTF